MNEILKKIKSRFVLDMDPDILDWQNVFVSKK